MFLMFVVRGGNRGVLNIQNMPIWACLGCSADEEGLGRQQTCKTCPCGCVLYVWGCQVERDDGTRKAHPSGHVFCVLCHCHCSVVDIGAIQSSFYARVVPSTWWLVSFGS